MQPNAARIMVGRIWHESNGFNPQPTTGDQFQFRQGEAILDSPNTSGSTLGGIVVRLKERGAVVLPSLSLTAPPSGLVDREFYLSIRKRMIEQALAFKPDAIALELHGAMGTTELADADGDLLTALRAAVGPSIPIGIGLDLHAHVTDAMLRAATICIACKENPHSDVVECGYKVADCVMATLEGRLNPVTTMAKVPMILPGAAETASGPLAEIHACARTLEAKNASIKDISLFNVFRYADDKDIGQAVVVLSDGEAGAATIAEDLAAAFWRARERFVDELLEIDEALDVVASDTEQRPFVLADMGDRVLAGAPGDSTAVLATCLSRGDRLRGAIPITDPKGVAAARAVGMGNSVSYPVGGRLTPGFSPLDVSGRVMHLSDGEFTLAGPFQGGEKTSLGPTAVLLVDDRLSLVLTTKPGFSHDPAMFTSQGVDIGSQDFLVVKSGYHFKLNFAGLATPLLMRTPGVGYYTKGLLRYRKSVFWPEHPIGNPKISARTFRHRAVETVTG